MSNLLPQDHITGVSMGIHMDQTHRAMPDKWLHTRLSEARRPLCIKWLSGIVNVKRSYLQEIKKEYGVFKVS